MNAGNDRDGDQRRKQGRRTAFTDDVINVGERGDADDQRKEQEPSGQPEPKVARRMMRPQLVARLLAKVANDQFIAKQDQPDHQRRADQRAQFAALHLAGLSSRTMWSRWQ